MHVLRATDPADFTRAALVLGEQRAWLEALAGDDVTAYQPEAVAEFAAPHTYYAPPHGTLVLAVDDDGVAVGVVAVRRQHDAPERAEIKRMFVRRTARGHGLGAALLGEALQAAEDLGCAVATLETDRAWMGTAHDLYRRFGFAETGSGADRWRRATAVLMERPLGLRQTA